MTNLDLLEKVLDSALELEEKGDRYVDGEKAKRFYIRSCELYSQANDIQSDQPQVLYNWARILFLLSEFKKPQHSQQQSCIWLSQALELYSRLALIEPENDDVLFNAAQTMHSWVLKSNSEYHKLNEAIWYLDQINGVSKNDSDTLILRIEILNSVMEFSYDINHIQQVFKTVTDLYNDSLGSQVILRIAESFHIFGFKVFDVSGVLDSSIFSKSLEYIEYVLSRNPKDVEGLCDKSDLCIAWADLLNDSHSVTLYTQGLESLTKASQLEPKNIDIMTRLGDIHLSRLRLYSNEDTKRLCAKNAQVYYQKVLTKPEMWTLYHYVKAQSWISDDSTDKAWNMLLKMASDNHTSLDEWIKTSDVLDVPFGPWKRGNL